MAFFLAFLALFIYKLEILVQYNALYIPLCIFSYICFYIFC
uniref:Uncharacterized protein n=1 Tax=Rhizophora mucronata TaxID=61149 RepID=A0A2P2R576_RHIMU